MHVQAGAVWSIGSVVLLMACGRVGFDSTPADAAMGVDGRTEDGGDPGGGRLDGQASPDSGGPDGGIADGGIADGGATTDGRMPDGGVHSGVQSGTATLVAGASSVSVAITAVTLARSFLVFGVRGTNVDPTNIQVRGRFASSGTLEFLRDGSIGDVTIQWYVAELTSGVQVQRGDAAMGSGLTLNVPITSVDPTKSFVLASMSNPGANFSADDRVRARLTSSTNLELHVGADTVVGPVEWQVVTMDGIRVQRGVASFSGSQLMTTAAVSAVDLGSSVLLTTNDLATTESGIGWGFFRARLTSSTQIEIARALGGADATVAWELIDFGTTARVQSGDAAFGTSTLTRSATIASVTPARSIVFLSGDQRAGMTPLRGDVGADNPGAVWFTATLTSSTQLDLRRAVTGSSTAAATWYVVELQP